jgi:16S rRNA (adenine1518-N6/adenine1519-N6)-dimethyltransferase
MNDLLQKAMLLIDGFHLKELDTYGQNFLIDEGILDEEIRLAELKPDDIVLDIGAGLGYEVDKMRTTCKIVAIEKHFKLFSYLLDKYELDKNVRLINGDALDIIYPKFNKVVSNPPYNIADRILKKLIRYDFQSGVMILPKDLSDGLGGNGKQNKLSMLISSFIEFKEIRDVPKEAFYPSPRVMSKMVKLKRKPYDFLQSVLKRDEMTVKNAVLRAYQEIAEKTKRQSREFLSKLDVDKFNFKDKEIKKLDMQEFTQFLSFLNNTNNELSA